MFPAIGMAAVVTHAAAITDDVFLAAAEALAHMTSLQVHPELPFVVVIGKDSFL